jgi:hypothetical protein
MNSLERHVDEILAENLNRNLEIVNFKFDKSKCTNAEEFKKAEEEFNKLYNSSPEMKKLIDSWK